MPAIERIATRVRPPTSAVCGSRDTGPPTAVSWQNWAGSVRCRPARAVEPRDRDELATLLRTSSDPVRVRGSGHSFTPLNATSDVLVHLGRLGGDVLTVDKPTGTATLQANATLRQLSTALAGHGLAFRNLGDIDAQTFAGATATATHGTGMSLPCLSAEIRALTLVTAEGEELRIDADRDAHLIRAARVSLGALGVVIEAEVAVQPAHRLHRRVDVRPLADVLVDAEQLWRDHRNVEFFVLPFSSLAVVVTHDETDASATSVGAGDDEATLALLRGVRTTLWRMPRLRRHVLHAALRFGGVREERVADSAHALVNERRTRFHELEYHLPVNQGLVAFLETLRLVEAERPEVFFPIECRITAGDDAMLSPFQGGPRISVAVHAHAPDPYEWLLERVEPIMRARGGRPHWGKLHTLAPSTLRELYPDYDAFRDIRAQLDPRGRLLSPYLAHLLDVDRGR